MYFISTKRQLIMHLYLNGKLSIELKDHTRTTGGNLPAIFSLGTFFLLPSHKHVHKDNSNL